MGRLEITLGYQQGLKTDLLFQPNFFLMYQNKQHIAEPVSEQINEELLEYGMA